MLRRLSNTWPVNTMTSSKKQAGDAPQPHLTLISTPENPHVNADLDPEIQNEPGSADPVSPTLDSISPTERKGFGMFHNPRLLATVG